MNSISGEKLNETYAEYYKWIEAKKNANETYDCVEVNVNSDTTLVDYVIIKKH